MKNKGVMYIVMAAFTYSIMPILMRFLNQEIPPFSQIFLRYIPALIFASIYMYWQKEKLEIKKKNIVYLGFATVCGYTLLNLAFTLSILNTEVSTAIFLMSTFIIFVPILASIFLKDKLSKVELFGIFFAFVGMLFLFRPNSFETWKLGGMYGLLSAIFYSIYLVFRRKLTEYSSINILTLSIISGVIIMGGLSLIFESSFYFTGEVFNLSLKTILILVLFGFDNFISWLLLTKGFESIKPSPGSLVLLAEPIFGVILGALVFAEIPTVYTVVGSVIILLASGVVILKGAK